jgi:hypothetical protein
MRLIYIIMLIMGTMLNTCVRGYKYFTCTFPETPVNMVDLNSGYDDFNMSSPVLGGTSPLCFSTNRNSEGKDFDIIYKLLDVVFYKSSGELFVGEGSGVFQEASLANANLQTATSAIRTMYDELGPFLVPVGDGHKRVGSGYLNYQNYIFLYANNQSGNFDIKFIHNLTSDYYSEPKNIEFLNSVKDDIYPFLTADSSMIYFCSNREFNFDIYKVKLNKSSNLLTSLNDATAGVVSKDLILSSAYDDKCPFIAGNLLVFTSNRPGGYGGFDLYYSKFVDGNWTAPVNFGNKINTEYDEFRPIVKVFEFDFTNDLMLFSSNRPKGNGGYDLYYVGIDKITK